MGSEPWVAEGPNQARLSVAVSARPTPRSSRLTRNWLSVAGLLVLLALAGVALAGPWIVPYPEDGAGAVHVRERLKPPSAQHLFGTDDVGDDVFTRVVLGARVSLVVGVAVIGLALVVGVALGGVAGFAGGWVNQAIMRLTDVFLTIPSLILALAIAAALGPSVGNMILSLAAVWWPGFCRLMQAEVLARREEAYVEAARTLGAGPLRTILRHVLPNCATPLIVKASLDVGFAILTAAGLGFIGVGVQPPTPEWGAMISVGRQYMPAWWWFPVFPGLAIVLSVLAFNLFGDGLRDLLDPRGKR